MAKSKLSVSPIASDQTWRAEQKLGGKPRF